MNCFPSWNRRASSSHNSRVGNLSGRHFYLQQIADAQLRPPAQAGGTQGGVEPPTAGCFFSRFARNPSILQSFNSSILQFFNPSILQFFNPSILQSFNPSILQSFNSSILQFFNPSILQSFNRRRGGDLLSHGQLHSTPEQDETVEGGGLVGALYGHGLGIAR